MNWVHFSKSSVLGTLLKRQRNLQNHTFIRNNLLLSIRLFSPQIFLTASLRLCSTMDYLLLNWISLHQHHACCSPPHHRVPIFPPSSTRRERHKNHLNEENTLLLLPTGIGERYGQTISNSGHAALLHRCELPLSTKVVKTNLGGPLVNSLLWAPHHIISAVK